MPGAEVRVFSVRQSNGFSLTPGKNVDGDEPGGYQVRTQLDYVIPGQSGLHVASACL